MSGAVAGPDGLPRCPWAVGPADYLAYHDQEWGRPVRDDAGLFERLSLEAFQSGLSWLTILRKRENFRVAFSGFEIQKVAAFGPEDVARLLADTGIVRNRAKIEATIANAKAALGLPGGLAAVVWSYSGEPGPAPRTQADIPSSTPASKALADQLRRHGFRFTGPVTAYAMMQACGLVNDHLEDCCHRDATDAAAPLPPPAPGSARVSAGYPGGKPTPEQLGLELEALQWHRSGEADGSFEVAFVTDVAYAAGQPGSGQPGSGTAPPGQGADWVLLRVAGDPGRRVLVYDRVEWESFLDGVNRGEFDGGLT